MSAGLAESWAVLRAAGVPIGHRTSGGRPSVEAVRAALARVLTSADDGELSSVERDALAAWLGALRRQWPTRLAAYAEGDAADIDAFIERTDGDRYLKLRRIALANLAR